MENKSNAEIVREAVGSSMFGCAENEIDKDSAVSSDVIEASYKWLTERFELAITTARSNLARAVLEEIGVIISVLPSPYIGVGFIWS